MRESLVEWCSFCVKKPYDGHVTVIDPDNGEMVLPACFDCYEALLKQ